MITIEQFKARCRQEDAEKIVREVILSGAAKHVSEENRGFLADGLARKYGLSAAEIDLKIVGSAKLGFSISEKKKLNLKRYRPFSALSDIDTAIVSPRLFRLIWDELCQYAHGFSWFPWNSQRLGDYMVCGWLRPDHFPNVRRCRDWWDLFSTYSLNARFGRKVRGALFYSDYDFVMYQSRAVEECIREEIFLSEILPNENAIIE